MLEDVTGDQLAGKSLAELHALAAERGIPRYRTLRREQLIEAIGGGPGVEAPAAERPAVAEPGRPWEDEEAERPDFEPRPFGREQVAEAEPVAGEPVEEEPAEEEPVEGEEPVEAEEAVEREAPRFADRDEDEETEPTLRETVTGLLDLVPDGFGFLRVGGFARKGDDVFVSRAQVRRLGLRQGDEISGPLRRRRRSERHSSLGEVETINDTPVQELGERPDFEGLTPIFPTDRLVLAYEPEELGVRMVDLVAPVWKGQRCIVSAPPQTGASTLLRGIVGAAARTDVVPIVLLIDARPEEVTEWQRSLDVPVQASTSDRSAEAHVQFAALAMERAKRLAEQGEDVLLAVDSITRLARAHALARPGSRREREQAPDDADVESAWRSAVQGAKRWFATARNLDAGGSITVVTTVRVDSGSALEQFLFEALSDIASADVSLSQELSGARMMPPIDGRRSYARQEGETAGSPQAERLRMLWRALDPLRPADAWEQLSERIKGSRTNDEVLDTYWGSI
jgi:transcription termination factor Rho